jgi:hypothetical protein
MIILLENSQDTQDQLANYTATNGQNNLDSSYDEFGVEDIEFLPANGLRRKKRTKRVKKGGVFDKVMSYTPLGMVKNAIPSKEEMIANRKRRQNRKDLRVKGRSAANLQKNLAKRDSAKAQQMSAKAIEAGVQSDVAIANAIASPTQPQSAPETKKGLSTNVKIAIGVGAFLVFSLIGYAIYKSNKNGK